MTDFNRDIADLVVAYKDAIKRIQAELLSLDLSDMSRAKTEAALREITAMLAALNEESAVWVAKYVPEASAAGVVGTMVALGTADSYADAVKTARISRVNSTYVNAVIADTQADLLAVTQNVDRRVRAAIRQATAESMRANMAAGINGRRTINRDTLAAMRRVLGSAVETGIIDAGGRRWKPEVYVDMVTRTKLAETERQTMINESIARNVRYGIISSHAATDACRFYEGKIVKLTPEAPGNYPFIGNLPRRDIFHPNCRHVVTPIRDPKRILGRDAQEPAHNPLPHIDRAIIPKEKLLDYALDSEHVTGKYKAVAFKSALGYDKRNWRDLVANMRANLPYHEAVRRPETKYGTPYSVRMSIIGPNGKTANVMSGWIIRADEAEPRLTSIYVDDK